MVFLVLENVRKFHHSSTKSTVYSGRSYSIVYRHQFQCYRLFFVVVAVGFFFFFACLSCPDHSTCFLPICAKPDDWSLTEILCTTFPHFLIMINGGQLGKWFFFSFLCRCFCLWWWWCFFTVVGADLSWYFHTSFVQRLKQWKVGWFLSTHQLNVISFCQQSSASIHLPSDSVSRNAADYALTVAVLLSFRSLFFFFAASLYSNWFGLIRFADKVTSSGSVNNTTKTNSTVCVATISVWIHGMEWIEIWKVLMMPQKTQKYHTLMRRFFIC